MSPRVLFVGRTRYRLPLPGGLARKWDALSARMQVRVVASGTGHDPRGFHPRAATSNSTATPRFYSTLPFVIAQELRSFRPDVVVAESPYEAAAAEAARAIARSDVRVVVEVHGDWRVWSSHYGSRSRALLRPASDAVAGWAVDHADGHRAVSGFTASLLEGRGRRPLGRLHDLLGPRGLHGPAGTGSRGEAGAVRRGARALQERGGACRGVAARLRTSARCAPPSGREGVFDGGGRRARCPRGRPVGARSCRRGQVADAFRRRSGTATTLGVGGPAAHRGRVVPARAGHRRDARRRDPRTSSRTRSTGSSSTSATRRRSPGRSCGS